MSLISVLTVSVPEIFFNIIIILLLAGERGFLVIYTRKYIACFLSALSLMVLASFVIRLVASDILVSVLLHIAVYTFIMRYVYGIRLIKIFICVLLLVLFLATIENAYIPFFIAFVSKSPTYIYESNLVRFLYGIPIRAFQIFAVISMWEFHIFHIATKINRKVLISFSMFLTLLIFLEMSVAYIFISTFKTAVLQTQIAYSVILVLFVIGNHCVFKLVHHVLRSVFMIGYKENWRLETESKEVMSQACTHLQCNNIEKAKNLLESWIENLGRR